MKAKYFKLIIILYLVYEFCQITNAINYVIK